MRGGSIRGFPANTDRVWNAAGVVYMTTAAHDTVK